MPESQTARSHLTGVEDHTRGRCGGVRQATNLGKTVRPMNSQIAARVCAAVGGLMLVVAAVLGLFVVGPDVVQGDYGRMLYVHPGVAWTMYSAIAVATVSSIAWLRTRRPHWDHLAGAGIEIAAVFAFLALVTGSIWGRPTWNSWWQWDPRITSTTLLFLLTIGALTVRRLEGTVEQRARRSAVAVLLAAVTVPIVHFSVDWWRSLHQKKSLAEGKINGLQLTTMLLSLAGFTLVFAALLIVRARTNRWEDEALDSGLGDALSARRAEAAAPLGTAAATGRA